MAALTDSQFPVAMLIVLGGIGYIMLAVYCDLLLPKGAKSSVFDFAVLVGIVGSALGLAAIFIDNRKLFTLSWFLVGLDIIYSIISFFLPSEYSVSLYTWSDIFLLFVSISFFIMQYYAGALLFTVMTVSIFPKILGAG